MIGLVQTKVDLRDVDKGVAAAQRAAHDLAPVFHALKPELRADLKDHAKKEEGPDGKWPKRAASPSRGRRRRWKGRRPRRARGRGRLLKRLPTAVTISARGTGIQALSKVRWSGAHQEGDKVGRGVKLPKREHVWMSPRFVDTAQSLVLEHVADAFAGTATRLAYFGGR